MSSVKFSSSSVAGRSRNPVLLDSNFIEVLESLAKEKQVAPEALFHHMVEETLAYPPHKDRFVDYLSEHWWQHATHSEKPSERLRMRADTASLLHYLSYATGLDKKIGVAAGFLISFKASSMGYPLRLATETIQ